MDFKGFCIDIRFPFSEFFSKLFKKDYLFEKQNNTEREWGWGE